MPYLIFSILLLTFNTNIAAEPNTSWLGTVQADITAREYYPTHTDKGLQAPNRALNLRVYFNTGSIQLHQRSDTEPLLIGMSLTAYGRGEQSHNINPIAATADKNTVSYQHPQLREWYINSNKGVEQGFDFPLAPFSQQQNQHSLWLDIQFNGIQRAELHGNDVHLVTQQGKLLSFAKLIADDATGKTLFSHMQIMANNRVRLWVDDRLAVYPIVIDPVLGAVDAGTQLESNQTSAALGISVASAGDVNNDGYADVIVGASGYDNGETDEGAAFIYHGSASGISTTATTTLDSNQALSQFGAAVASAGDVNNDGYADVIVGAYRYDNGQTNEGSAFIYHGSASGISTTATTTLESNQALAEFGGDVASAGDVNNDGYADVIVGASPYDNGQDAEGGAFIYHGSASGISTTVTTILESNQATAHLGKSVASAGDVNNDGYADVIVGAYVYDKGQADEGVAFIYHGSASGISTTATTTLESNQIDARMGGSVASAGDVNNDGYADVIVGATNYDNGQTNEGRVFIYHGSASGISTTATTTLESNQSNASMGNSVASAGDVNNDGYADVIVGASAYDNGETNEGGAFIYHGSASGISSTVITTLESNQVSAFMGRSVASAGDVNNDGFADVIVGVQLYDKGETNEGAAFVYMGSTAGIIASNSSPTLTSFTSSIDTTNEDTEVEITFAELIAQGDTADSDGTVTAFIVQAVSTGTLKIGTSAETATTYAASTNDTIDDITNNAYWTPANNANGTLNAFTVTAKDNEAAESVTAIQTTVMVNDVNDIPTLTTFSTVIDSTNEDTEVEITFAELIAQGDTADSDGTVTAFIVQAVSTGTLKIGTSAETATTYAASTNDTIDDITNNAYWTPASNTNGTLNAFSVIAKDDDSDISASAIPTMVTVNDVNDIPILTSFAGAIGTTNEDTEVEITFAELITRSDAYDIDGTVEAFIVQAVSTGILRIGTDAVAAIAYNATPNNSIDSNNNAYWTPTSNAGTINAFTVTVKDNDADESISAIQTQINVEHAPVIINTPVIISTPVISTPVIIDSLIITEGNVSVTLDEDNSPLSFVQTLNAVDSNRGDILTWSINSPASHGIASVSGTGSSKALSYSPNKDYFGADSFNVLVDDGNRNSDEITVSLTINPRNDVPAFSHLGNQNHLSGTNTPQTLTAWAHSFDMGSADENSSQSVAEFIVSVVSDSNEVLAGLVTIDNIGTLNYELTGNNGSVQLAVTLRDDGGSLGTELSAVATLYIGVGALTINADNLSFTESSQTAITTITVNRSGNIVDDLIVNLEARSNQYKDKVNVIENRFFIPSTITILAGQSSSAFVLDLVNNNSYEGNTTVTITANTDGYAAGFLGFTLNDDDNAPIFNISAVITGQGQITGTGAYSLNNSVRLTAIADVGWIFDSWSGDCDSTGQVFMDANKTCIATFSETANYLLSATQVGQGLIAGLGEYIADSLVTLTATAADGWVFVAWSEACNNEGQVLMSQAQNCHALFELKQFSLTAIITGEGQVNKQGIYPAFSRVVLSAVRPEGWLFTGWGQDCNSDGVAILDADKVCSASFEPIPPAGIANPLADFAPEVFATLTIENFASTAAITLNLLDKSQINAIPVAVLETITAEQMANLSADGISGISPAQLANISPEAFSDLNAESLAAFNPIAIQQLSNEQILAMNPQQVSQMPSTGLTQLLVNIDADQLSPQEAQALVPDDWKIDLRTGEISVPAGTKISLRSAVLQTLPTNISYPDRGLIDISTQLAIGGNGQAPSALNQIQQGLNQQATANNDFDYILSQTYNGILNVRSSTGFTELAFIPDSDNMFQITGDIGVGLQRDSSGFYSIVTAGGKSYRVLPAPADPLALPQIFGEDSQVTFNNDGSVYYQLDDERRAGRTRRVLVFDPFIEAPPPELLCCLEQNPNAECFCEGIAGLSLFDDESSRRATATPPKITYPDGRSQKVTAGFLEAEQFTNIGKQIAGVEEIRRNANGTYMVIYQGQRFLITPKFDINAQTSTQQTAEIVVEQGVLKYQVPFDLPTDNTRRAGRSRQVLVFEPSIEPMPFDVCEETEPGQFLCDFGNGELVRYPDATW